MNELSEGEDIMIFLVSRVITPRKMREKCEMEHIKAFSFHPLILLNRTSYLFGCFTNQGIYHSSLLQRKKITNRFMNCIYKRKSIFNRFQHLLLFQLPTILPYSGQKMISELIDLIKRKENGVSISNLI